LGYWQRKVDPAGTMAPAERERKAKQLYSAHMTRLALRSSLSRSKAKKARALAAQLEADARTADTELADADPDTLAELGINLDEPGGTAA
jgi:hypothetical protein